MIQHFIFTASNTTKNLPGSFTLLSIYRETKERSPYLADRLWFSDLSSIPVGHEGVKDEQQPLQLLCRLFCSFSFCLRDAQDLHHTMLEMKIDNILAAHVRVYIMY